MQLILPLFAISIVAIIGLFSSKKIMTLKKHIPETPIPTITKIVLESPSPIASISQTTINITQTTKPTTIPAAHIQAITNSSDFNYPGSQSNGNNEYTSQDDPDKITNWYKDKIKSKGYSAKSFIVTKTNDNVNNVLAGANGNSEIKVTITKISNDSITHIKISTNP